MRGLRNGSTVDDYRRAPSNDGPLAAEWADKPHRLIYDLAGEIDTLRAENARLREILARIEAQVSEPLNAHHTLSAFNLGAAMAETRAALAAQEPGR